MKILKEVEISDIEQIENEQKKLREKIPFKVKYHNGYLWQMYYSEDAEKYFMIVTLEDSQFASLFYLIKKQIEFSKTGIDESVYVPINSIEYSREYLSKADLSDIEKYIWYFTKEWPEIYETYDNEGNMRLAIIGKLAVYEKVKSLYRIDLCSKEEAVKFFKGLKAIFIMQTEIPNYYKFLVKISDDAKIEFYHNEIKIQYDDLAEFIKNEYLGVKEKLNHFEETRIESEKKLEELKIEAVLAEKRYVEKEKEISNFLECKKTFFGKIKYFMKIKKGIKNSNIKITSKKQDEQNEKIESNNTDIIFNEKEFYNIEDLVEIYNILEKKNVYIKNAKQDIEAITNKINSINIKIKNAENYLAEIEEHKKNIFDFWKFTNKDRILGLIASQEEKDKIKKNKLEKSFVYDEDFEELGIQIDKTQREILSKEECDCLYVLTTDLKNLLDEIRRKGSNIDKERIKEFLEDLKKQANKTEILFNYDTFDIFGGIAEDRTKIRMIDGKKHRENEKNKFKNLDIRKNIELDEFLKNIEQIQKTIEEAILKIENIQKISVYKAQTGLIEEDIINIFDIDPEKAIEKVSSTELKLYRINVPEKMPMVYCSNILYYDNYNKTLPLGMNISDEVILDNNMINLNLVKRNEFKICIEKEDDIVIKKISAYEYDAEVKRRN